MAISGQEDYSANYESESDIYDSDDSEEDPSFDISRFPSLSLKGKTKSRIFKETEEGTAVVVVDVMEATEPELDEKDQKQYENILKIINAGELEKLKVDQCKIYLRKHGLRLAGNKDTLINRIKEHIKIVDGCGEKKYPASSFVLNCKGDACKGDVVMFKQNVYEKFNVASRSATGPPCGERVVAGRIVKESYGAAKQQHTFTIEVLWSKGEKPLPPLHPLLVKGRNLYRLKTVRQRWEDEGERQKLLSEKHARGSIARLNREARLQEKEKCKIIKAKRLSRMEDQSRKQEKNERWAFQSKAAISQKMGSQPQEQKREIQKTHKEQDFQEECWCSKPCKEDTKVLSESPYCRPNYILFANVLAEKDYQRQPLMCMNYSHSNVPHRRSYVDEDIGNSGPSKTSFNRHVHDQNINFWVPERQFSKNPCDEQSMNYNSSRNPHAFEGNTIAHSLRRGHKSHEGMNGYEQKQLCRYYAQGRCYYGENCKYLHEYKENRNHAQGTNEKRASK